MRLTHRRGTPASVRGRRIAARVVVTGTALALMTACSDQLPPSGRPTPQPTQTMTPNPALGVPAHPLVLVDPVAGTGADSAFVQSGSARTTVSEPTLDGGQVRIVDEGPGGTPALRFPAYAAGRPYPRAMVVVDNVGDQDQFNPGAGDFSWGTDFDLDARSTGRADDNGNNMIQRGLSSDNALFKLEVDVNMRPTCTVRGSEGTVIARSNLRVLPGGWYRVRCDRSGDHLTVSVGPVLSDGTAIPIARSVQGAIGVVTQPKADIPISIGGKVGATGQVYASASDQFNGMLRNPFLLITG